MRFIITMPIRTSREVVFDYLARFENVPRWNYAIAETNKTSAGPVGVGTTYRQRRTLPRPAEETFEVVEFERPVRLAIKGDFGPFSGVLRYTLEPDGNATILTNEAELAGRGLASLLGAVAGGRVREAVTANLAELKAILEGANA